MRSRKDSFRKIASKRYRENRDDFDKRQTVVGIKKEENQSAKNTSIQRNPLPRVQWRQRSLRPIRIRRANRLRFPRLFEPHDVLIRNFPAKLLVLAVLLQMLFQKDRFAGIGYERSRGGQQDVTGAVMHFDPAPQKGGISGHG